MADVIRSSRISVQHGFLDAGQSDRRDFAAAVGEAAALAGPVRVKQVHSSRVVTVTELPSRTVGEEADALVTNLPGVALAIVTADCAPVLLADRDAGVIGAAHAGWRGAVGGVIANTVTAMEALGADRRRVAAAIGPTIAQASYEVGEDMMAQFGDGAARFFAANETGAFQFDLPGFVSSCLTDAGVAEIDDLALDTYQNEARFHSYRRATHRSASTDGRQYSVIALPA